MLNLRNDREICGLIIFRDVNVLYILMMLRNNKAICTPIILLEVLLSYKILNTLKPGYYRRSSNWATGRTIEESWFESRQSFLTCSGPTRQRIPVLSRGFFTPGLGVTWT